MGTVKCERCGGRAEADSIEDGAPLIDHAIGLASGKPCGPDRAELIMIEEKQDPSKAEDPKEKEPNVEESKRSSKATKSSDTEAS